MPGRFLIPRDTLEEMAGLLSEHDRDEMAIPSYLHRNPALRRMAWARIHEVVRQMPRCVQARGAVLDFGCGTGVLFESALQHAEHVYGVDVVLDAARLWVERRGLQHRVSLLTPEEAWQTLEDDSVDMIIAAEVLEHIEDLSETLAAFRRVLRPGGALLSSLPTENAAYRLGRKLAGFEGHYHKDDAASIDRKLGAAGWSRQLNRKIPAPGPLAIYEVSIYRPR